MKNIDELVKKICSGKKVIKIEDILNLELSEYEYNALLNKLEEKGYFLEFNETEVLFEENNLYADDMVKAYLKEIGKIPLLSVEEEKFLFNKYKLTKDKKIKDKIIKSNLRLVVSVAKANYSKLQYSVLEFIDLIQEGNKGLIKAIDKYDVTLGFKFSTYATWWIRQSIVGSVKRSGRTIRVPSWVYEAYSNIKRYSRKFLNETGKEPSNEEIAQTLNIPVEKVEEVLKAIEQLPISLETLVGEDGDSTIMDYIPSNESEFEEQILNQIFVEDIKEIMESCLTERECFVLTYRVGIINKYNKEPYPRTLDEIGKILGVTKERIRRLEASALRKVRIELVKTKLAGESKLIK